MFCGEIKIILYRIYMLFFRFKMDDFRFNSKDFEGLSKYYNKPKFIYGLHYIICSYLYGCDLSEYLIFEFCKINHNERSLFITRLNKHKIYKQFRSNNETKIIFDKKPEFNQHFQSFLKRKWMYCEEEAMEDIINFILSLDKVIVKPATGLGGKGIEIIYVKNIPDIKMFAKRCYEERLLLEEVLYQVKELHILNPDSINTIRIITVIGIDKKINIISASLRVGRKGAVVDNISSGGIMYPVDINEGIVIGPGLDDRGNKYLFNPNMNIIMYGYRIPRWREIIETINQAVHIFDDARMVGWDICVINDGISIIEGNLTPGSQIMQSDKVGRKRLMKSLI